MSSAPRPLGLVVEGPDDARTVPAVADRLLTHELHAHAPKLDRIRSYRGLHVDKPFLSWSAVDQEAARRRVPRRHGHFGGEPALEDARTAWYALQCFVAEDPQPAAVLLVRDSDGKLDERARGLKQAHDDRSWPFPVILGVAHTMRECWVLAAFVPEDKGEKIALAELRKELGFDPTLRSDQLDATKETSKKSPKRVLSRLTGDDLDREEQCWAGPGVDHLRARGEKNGLSAFLRELQEKLVPVFDGKRKRD
jgi:hypothetical protein